MTPEYSEVDVAKLLEKCGRGDRLGHDELFAILPLLMANNNLDAQSFAFGALIGRHIHHRALMMLTMMPSVMNQNTMQTGGGTTTNPMMNWLPMLLLSGLGREDVEFEEKKWYGKPRHGEDAI